MNRQYRQTNSRKNRHYGIRKDIEIIEDYQRIYWQRSSRKKVMLKYNKKYATQVFNYVLKNSEWTISVSGIDRRYRNNKIRTYKTFKRDLINAKEWS